MKVIYDEVGIKAKLLAIKQRHEVHSDSWCTCPKASAEQPNDVEARCSNDGLRESGICTCGADSLNAQIDALVQELGL